ncbi:MAG: thioredoxin domain-containing protein [Deltaproteobacteria bacterium]|nr:thioredoxin domain-containing protein [Deltaproteobacteria bacterium]
MLRTLAWTVTLVGVIGGSAFLATHHVIEDNARAQHVERDLAALRDDMDELRLRIDSPALPPKPPARPGETEPSTVYAVPVGDAPVRGPADAPVTIVAFTDYQCPFCGRAETTLAALRERYPEDVRIAVHHNPLPFHARAFDAAVAAECAGEQGLFWPAHDRFFADQREIAVRPPSAIVDSLLGLHGSSFARCLSSERARAKITEDQRLAERFGARGTPTFFVNGRVLVGAQPLERFVEAVERELAAARRSDIPRAEYYRRAVLEQGALGVVERAAQ